MILDLHNIALAYENIAHLTRLGWSFRDEPHRIVAERELAAPDSAAAELRVFGAALMSFQLLGRHGEFSVELKLINGRLEIISLPSGGLERFFEEADDRENARRLEDRETEASYQLPLSWKASAGLDLSRLLVPNPLLDIRATLSNAWLVEEISAAGISAISRLIPRPGMRRIYVVLDVPHRCLHFGCVSFVGLAASQSVPPPAEPKPGEEAATRATRDIPRPFSLLPLSGVSLSGPWATVEDICSTSFVVSIWQHLASAVHDDGTLDFLGFKRVVVALPAAGTLRVAHIEAARRLYDWAFQDLSLDRLLAVRQVVSLYQDGSVIDHSDDVLLSAESVFLGLRSDAVSEMFAVARDAQALAVESVRQSVKSVQDLAKSATERVLASLVAVAAVMAANSTKSLSEAVGRNLLLMVAFFLCVLAGFALFIEGPMLSLPLRNLERDIRHASPMLTENQLRRAIALPSVVTTRSRVQLLRVVVPSTYLLVAGAILIWGYPRHYL